MYTPGQRIVCVNDAFGPLQQFSIPNLPKKDEVYTVRDAFRVTRNGTATGIWAVHLEELENPMLPHPSGLGQFEPSFAADRFAVMSEDEVDSAAAIEEMLRELQEEQELVELT